MRVCTQERNRSRDEIRILCTAPTTPEAVCFPAAAQVARVRRVTTERKPGTVALLTSAPPEQLDAQTWLRLNRGGFGGIENGLHQRLDVSLDDDRCRVPRRCETRGTPRWRCPSSKYPPATGITGRVHEGAENPREVLRNAPSTRGVVSKGLSA